MAVKYIRLTLENKKSIVDEITKKGEEELEKIRERLSKKITEHLMSQVPNLVREVFETHPGYFSQSKSVRLVSVAGRLGHIHLVLDSSLPHNNNYLTLNVREDGCPQALVSLADEYSRRYSEHRNLRTRMQNTLGGFKSAVKLAQALPSLEPLLRDTPKPAAELVCVDGELDALIRNALRGS